ncbi:ubl carboxyl-terminal hydrolase 18-like isoform X1 [Sinocyclocheilus anshuiensis]|uniref:ubl carboxyl-terminal hydrolase 18-like isoform X1 n=2 Tax=Sinocyclocheilus anshuiensis TaxID=1608454 RepID=UPI0007B896A6|nr:PREDICTED: ubl carboxyl-terminal hydrolase 18-like isoform X1 [Sinocyclocheilus anshuiensis]
MLTQQVSIDTTLRSVCSRICLWMGKYWSKMARLYYRSASLDYEVRGLLNYSLSCCVNALLQSFSATTELLDILNKCHPSDGTDERNVPLQLRNALEAMRDKSHPAPHINFLNCLYHQAIRPSTQQDADEIFHIVLNLSQKQMPDTAVAQEIRSLYEIKVETQVVCSKCKFIHRAPSSLFSLPLAICERENTLESCINSFFKLQKLPDSEKFYCDRCDEKQPCTHEVKLASLPPILCVHLKRFRNNDGFTRKLSNKVTFLETFSTGIFAAGQSENADCLKADECYSLYAVVVHIGTAMFGHYTAFIRSNQDEMWFYADDSRVQPSTWAEVQVTYGGSHRYGDTAYFLLYRKKSWNSSG